jgi:hypothetical protein
MHRVCEQAGVARELGRGVQVRDGMHLGHHSQLGCERVGIAERAWVADEGGRVGAEREWKCRWAQCHRGERCALQRRY